MPCLSTFPLFNIQSPSVLPIVLCKQTLHKHPFVLLSKLDLLKNKRKSDVSTFSRFVLQSSAGLHEGEFDDFGECSEKELTTRWTNVGPDITEEQKEAISQLPPKISNRCKALLRRIICFSPESDSLSDILAAWVKAMKPRRADWLLVLKHIRRMGNPLFFKVLSIPACFMLQLCHFMLFSVFCANVSSVEAGTAYSAFCLFYSFHKTFLYARCDVQFLVDQARVERGLGDSPNPPSRSGRPNPPAPPGFVKRAEAEEIGGAIGDWISGAFRPSSELTTTVVPARATVVVARRQRRDQRLLPRQLADEIEKRITRRGVICGQRSWEDAWRTTSSQNQRRLRP